MHEWESGERRLYVFRLFFFGEKTALSLYKRAGFESDPFEGVLSRVSVE